MGRTTPPAAAPTRSVALVTLGCTRNEVDSEELAGRLEAEGWTLVDDAAEADVAVVNTCGFVEQAKKDSIDALLEASDLKEDGRTRAVVAVGCLAERYGKDLAEQLPEADAVLGFDSYRDLSTHLRTILGGGHVPSHTPGRPATPASPLARGAAGGAAQVALPGHNTMPYAAGRRTCHRAAPGSAPVSTGGLGAAQDRIGVRPSLLVLRDPDVPGGLRLRPPADIVAEARWLAA